MEFAYYCERSNPAHKKETSKQMKVLVVDDVQANCRVLKALLARHGECDIAMNGREAVTAFQTAWKNSAPYQLICLDVMLPDIDGMKVLEVLRKMEEAMKVEESERVKVFMITSLDETSLRLKAREFGVSHYITKPISSKELTECLHREGLIA